MEFGTVLGQLALLRLNLCTQAGKLSCGFGELLVEIGQASILFLNVLLGGIPLLLVCGGLIFNQLQTVAPALPLQKQSTLPVAKIDQQQGVAQS